MATKYQLTNVVIGTPGSFSINGDHTNVFKIASTGQPATTFEVKDTSGLNGTYAVFAAGYNLGTNKTEIMVNGVVPSGTIDAGYITNCSVYRLSTPENDEVIIVDVKEEDTTTSLNFVGRSSAGWGETIQQNILSLLCNFSSPTSPVNPVKGQLWFDESSTTLKIWINSWEVLNQSASNPTQIGSHTHNQAVSSDTWVVNHGLNSTNLVFTTLVDTGGGVLKPIMPSDVNFVTNNQLEIIFSVPKTGKVSIIRAVS